MRSMTGYGSASGKVQGSLVSVEISTVNSRDLEITIRLPALWTCLEAVIRDKIKDRISRGKVYIWIRRQTTPETIPAFNFNESIAQEYLKQIQKLKQIMKTTEDISINTLVQLPGIFESTLNDEEIEATKKELEPIVDKAISMLTEFREQEGAKIEQQIREHLNELSQSILYLEQKAPTIIEEQKERLRSKIKEILLDPNIKEERLAMEVVLWADKLDITEEINRVKTHLSRFEDVFQTDQNGKILNFLVLELNRELNTMGAKLRNAQLAWETVRMKTILEKIREQIQNVE